jgi:hypothetical protein
MRRLPEEAPVTGVKPLVAWLTDVLQTLPSSSLMWRPEFGCHEPVTHFHQYWRALFAARAITGA